MWESELDNIVSKRDKLEYMNINQLKIEIHEIYEKDEKITTNFEAINDEDGKNKAYLDEKLSKKEGHLSFLEKDYSEFQLQHNKQSRRNFNSKSCANDYTNTLW